MDSLGREPQVQVENRNRLTVCRASGAHIADPPLWSYFLGVSRGHAGGALITNLDVCDASVFPEALDRPTVITIAAFGKRLCRHILEQ